MKKCCYCKQYKYKNEFNKDKTQKSGLQGMCKLCQKICRKKNYEKNKEIEKNYQRQYYRNHTNEINKRSQKYYQNNKKKRKEYDKKRYKKYKEKFRQYSKEYYKNNSEKAKKYSRKYYKNHKKEIKKYRQEYQKKRCKSDINYKISCNLRSRLSAAIKNNSKSGSAVKDLGCTIKELKQYLEKQFRPGMNWKNYGKKWEIDHVEPLCGFNLKNRKELLKACHYTNLRPLWKEENLKKAIKDRAKSIHNKIKYK